MNNDYDRFKNWLKKYKPNILLLEWQDEFAKTYFSEDPEIHFTNQPRASGKTFICDLIKEFRQYQGNVLDA